MSQIHIAGQGEVNFGVYSEQNEVSLITDNTALIICEEMFIGLEPGSDIEENPIVKLAKKGVTTFIIPNASPNANYKMQNRLRALQKIADHVQASGNTGITMHYVNWYGTHSGTNFFDGAAHHIHFDAAAQKYQIKTQAHDNKPYVFDSQQPENTANEGEFFLT